MSDLPKNHISSPNGEITDEAKIYRFVRTTPRSLANDIFRSSNPEEYVKKIPAQNLYLIVQGLGLESSTELLEIVTPKQYKTILDFDLWQKDSFDVERFWHWLTVLDAENGYEPLSAFLSHIDVRLLGLLVGKYVQAFFSDEPTDLPPDDGYFTPDNGNAWIKINIEDQDRYRLFGKLLALIFERDSALFYQLLAESGYVSSAELEEESYTDRSRRLWDEGLPDAETAASINRSTAPEQILIAIQNRDEKVLTVHPQISAISQRIAGLQPLVGVLESVCQSTSEQELFEGEIALLVNAAMITYGVQWSDAEAVQIMVEKVKGCLNIGLEKLATLTKAPLSELVPQLGLQRVYQLGKHELLITKKEFFKLLSSHDHQADLKIEAICEALNQPFPGKPAFLTKSESRVVTESLETEHQAIQTRAELAELLRFIPTPQLSSKNEDIAP